MSRVLRAALVAGIPYLWLLAFFLVPFLIVLKISLSEVATAIPPYRPVFDGLAGLPDRLGALSLDNYRFLAVDPRTGPAHAAQARRRRVRGRGLPISDCPLPIAHLSSTAADLPRASQ